MAGAFTGVMTNSAFAQVATATPTSAPASLLAEAAASGDCTDGVGINSSAQFWRCTGTSPSSPWVASSCNPGEYNAITYYNLYGAINACGTRVWIHEYTYPTDTTSGWSWCYGPGVSEDLGPTYAHPENIMVSDNSAAC
jgi:hypothetical protein